MPKPPFDQDYWERLWSKTIREHPNSVASRQPNRHLTTELASLNPGRALDAGCGHGAETLWLATKGWQVTAADFSASSLAFGQSLAEAAGSEMAERITWLQTDLANWSPQPDHYDLVVCLYVHIAGPEEEMANRMAKAVARRGTLLLVGHRPMDSITRAPTAAANQQQFSVEGAKAALDPKLWELLVAEERQRATPGSGVDAVIRARRRA